MILQAASRFALIVLLLASTGTLARADCSPHPADVAPGLLGSETPTPDWTVLGNGAVDVSDVLALLGHVVGNHRIVWAPPVAPACVDPPGNVSPGTEDEAFSPPRWTPAPDLLVDVGDVLAALRMVVGLTAIDPAFLQPVVAEAGAGDRVLSGSVIDSIDAAALAGVVVTALQDDSPVGETSTDALGKFLLQGLPTGVLKLSLDGSAAGGGGKFGSLQVQVEVDTSETTSLDPITLADQTNPDGASGKFTGDESGTVNEEIDLSSGDGDVGLETGSGGKITVDDMPADGEVDVSVVPVEGEDLPESPDDPDGGTPLNSTGEVSVAPSGGKFEAGGSGVTLGAVGGTPGFDLILPNRQELPVGTVVDIWHWDGTDWVNCTAATGRSGIVVSLPGGRTAVRADGAATQGGLYIAAVPSDPACWSAVSGQVVDDQGEPLAGIRIVTSLGAAGVTDASGYFDIPAIPAYTGLTLDDCQPKGFQLWARAGVELGNASTLATVADEDVALGGSTWVGQLELTVPQEGCLSGRVLKNGAPLAGPVSITGTESLTLGADAQGRFFTSGLTPGAYTASFLFPGEALPRRFNFSIAARRCTTVRLEVNEGAGASRVIVEVRFDHDNDVLTPNLPTAGARVRLTGQDAVSMAGLEAVTGANGRVAFDGVTPPYDIVAVQERPLYPGALPARTNHDGPEPFMRIGTGLETTAPLGFVTLPLAPPWLFDPDEPYPPGSLSGIVSNLPPVTPGYVFNGGPLRQGAYYEEPCCIGIDEVSGAYGGDGWFQNFHLGIGEQADAWPPLWKELRFFGPYLIPPPGPPDFQVHMELDIDYSMPIGSLSFDRALSLSYTNFLTTQNVKEVALSGRRQADGLSFWSLLADVADGAPFPPMIDVPDPATTDIDLLLELVSEDGNGFFDDQICIVPLAPPLGPSLAVDFPVPPHVTSPGGGNASPVPISVLQHGPIAYFSSDNVSTRGWDQILFETSFFEPPAGQPTETSFRRLLPPSNEGSGTLGDVPGEFVFVGTSLLLRVQSHRSDAFPASHMNLFGPNWETIMMNLPHQDEPVCLGGGHHDRSVVPD